MSNEKIYNQLNSYAHNKLEEILSNDEKGFSYIKAIEDLEDELAVIENFCLNYLRLY